MTERRQVFFKKLSNAWLRRGGMLAVAGMVAFGSIASFDADARRVGGGRSIGKQAPALTQRSATPPAQTPMQNAQPAQAAQRAQPGAAAPAAAPNRSRWLAPLAGLAAGLGIAALLSHLGLGGAFASMMANVLIVVALAAVAIWLIRKFTNRRNAATPALQGAGVARTGRGFDFADAPRAGTGFAEAPAAAPVAEAVPVPAGFDTNEFLRGAKVHFVRLQAAWDAADLDDIREFTTPEMFAELRVDLAARGAASNRTDVVQLDAALLGVEDTRNGQFASVRFEGLIRETADAAAEPFVEVWNLSRAAGEGWLLAGIQQVPAQS